MSDYLFILESRLTPDQNRVIEHVQTAATDAAVSLFLTGGAMRDLLRGAPIRDLDFSVEGPALKLAHALKEAGAQIVAEDENRRSAELLFPGQTTVQVAMCRQERYAKTGAKPQVTPATIQEDLRGRDFTINAIALSLNRASRGLLLDPTNGLADLGSREMRSTHPYIFYDDPSRLLRLVRLRVRLGFTVEERTRTQFDNAREAHVQDSIPPHALLEELRRIAEEPSPSDVLHALEEEGLLALFSPALSGAKLNLPALVRLEKAQKLVEPAHGMLNARLPMLLEVLTGKLTAKEKSAFVKAVDLPKAEKEHWRHLLPGVHKLEAALQSERLRKPSQVYQILAGAPADQVAFLLYHSEHRVVPERIRHYLLKYLPAMQEVAPAEWEALEGAPGSAKYERARQALVAAHLDVRPRKAHEPDTEPPVLPPR
jgi:tRNA nucleotidyltransferase (CCA-adding enzyme)